MATYLESLKSSLVARANEIADDVSRYTCLELIDQLISALTAQSSSVSSDITSYSIGGRSVTRSGTMQSRIISDLWRQINELLYGYTGLADLSHWED